MRIGSLFSGAGGLDMAVEAVFGGEVIWQSEVDKAASKVLAYRFPCAPNLGDITQVDWKSVETPDVLCGGFPCQDVSAAGKRSGIRDGTRSGLWSIFADAIDALRPPIVVIENVRGLLSAKAHRNLEPDDSALGDGSDGPVLRAAGAVLGDLADLRYDAQWVTYAAGDVGAPHRRERVFILASATHSPSNGWDEGRPEPAGLQRGFDAAVGSYGHVEPSPVCDTVASASTKCTDCPNRGDNPQRLGFVVSDDVDLLPTPCAQQSGNTPENHLAKKPGRKVVTDLAILVENNLLASGGELLCTPSASDGAGGKTSRSGSRIDEQLLGGQAREMQTDWGKYAPAIHRWEQLTRPAPAPTEPNKNGNPRLSAAFSEWLMGWPAGWVTDPDIGISRNDQLRIIGNGVCPQQAIAALRYLLSVSEVAA